MRIALHARVRPDKIEEYESAHERVPAELTDAIRSAGATAWTIWRSGTDLFHVIDCDDYAELLAVLRDNPVNIAWQNRMAGLLEIVHDYSAGGADMTLPMVWTL